MATGNAGDADQELNDLRSELRQVAHDISTPLGVVRMVAYYLQTNPTDGPQREHYCQVISQNVAKVEANLDRLRALSEESAPGAPPAQPPDVPKS